MSRKVKVFMSLAIVVALSLSLVCTSFAGALGQGNFSLWQSGSTKPWKIGTNGFGIPEGGTEVMPNYVGVQQNGGQTAHGLQWYGCFKGAKVAPDGAQEMAVFICDNVSTWTGKEMGFLKTLNDNTTKAYLQGPGGVYKWYVVASGDNGYHTYKATVRDSGTNKGVVDYYVDGVYKCSLSNPGQNYWNLWYYFVGTTHRTKSGWNAAGCQIEMYNMTTF